ncbi:putative periplasmic chaperone protein [Yersinia rohdei]|uniref:Putative periplasmic chaperone protein n=1 Tax=Yersinia rohdei TaxID=29485 RepID=A0A0U1HXD3_YERRO|nr:fimbria/pilus chaperone family protein [Yersinia rohdei]MDN0095195.1 fimbria/pilus chaperone family protein [Yersinia rohdei]OWF76150.1 fimbrial protein [Yersinia rohdei]CNE87167.1 putative periplasmic chaperone protein [Yersinia rohdei]CQI95844.1 putative periplasmic chaperone protein [Yersinia rohdei]CQJ49992.1 putative periplasmic chaperone protein [Yersinia rohdei]
MKNTITVYDTIFSRFKSFFIFNLLISLSCLSMASYASFKLESTTVILKESEGRASFTIDNTSANPILLVTKLIDIDGKDFSKQILISPPVTRIDGGQSQQVNFVLKKGAVLDTEVLLKAAFEGVEQVQGNSTVMPIRQEIGFLIQPSAVPQIKNPWEELVFTASGNKLTIKNPGKHVVRLGPQVFLVPNNEVVPLGNAYIMPGTTKEFSINTQPTSVKITPLSRYGFVQPEVVIPIKS